MLKFFHLFVCPSWTIICLMGSNMLCWVKNVGCSWIHFCVAFWLWSFPFSLTHFCRQWRLPVVFTTETAKNYAFLSAVLVVDSTHTEICCFLLQVCSGFKRGTRWKRICKGMWILGFGLLRLCGPWMCLVVCDPLDKQNKRKRESEYLELER